jgi:hypothetical protein
VSTAHHKTVIELSQIGNRAVLRPSTETSGSAPLRKRFRAKRIPARVEKTHQDKNLEHDPEKWKPVFPRDKRGRVCAEIMLKQRDEIMMRFHQIAA